MVPNKIKIYKVLNLLANNTIFIFQKKTDKYKKIYEENVKKKI